MFKKYRVLTLSFWVIFLLWAYAKDRHTKAELMAEDPMLEDLTDVFADPHIKKTIEEHEAWMQTEDSTPFKQRITQRQIDLAIETALEKIRD